MGSGIFFFSYAVLEVPSNLMLARVGARVWIARIMLTWGALSAAMIFVKRGKLLPDSLPARACRGSCSRRSS